MLRFEDIEALAEADVDCEKVRYEGNIRDMFTKVQRYNDKAQPMGASRKTLILDCLPDHVLSQMHVGDLTGKTDQEMIDIVTKAGRTAEKWEEARKNLRSRTPKPREKPEWKPINKIRVKKDSNSRKELKERKFVDRKVGGSMTTCETETGGVRQAEFDRTTKAGECMMCAWPADRQGNHKTMDCYGPVKTDTGTVHFPKAKEYQKLMVGVYELVEDQKDLYTE